MKRHFLWSFLVFAVVVLATGFSAWGKSRVQLEGVININTASVEELILLPGIGEVKAKEIVAQRAAKPFANKEDLLEARGIGEKLIALWMPHLVFEGKTTLKEVPVNVNP